MQVALSEALAVDPSENDLLERAQAGEREACAEILQLHYRPVYGFLVHLTRNPDLAADLTQEVFVAAWQKLAQFEGRSTLKTWLCRIAWFRYVDDRRSTTRQQKTQQELEQQWQEVPVASPLQSSIDSEEMQKLYESVQQLNRNHLSVIVLHYFQGLSFNETAQVLDVPLGTVKWWNTKALIQLRKNLSMDNQ